MPHTTSNPSYRADIDGLRAVAVLGVVFFHAGLGFPGGYVGVDVFFVISGFLITSLILKDLRNGSFSLLDFWERRARRILPALTVVVLAVLAAGWFLLLPSDYEVLGTQIIALVLFSSNIKFWRETGYFAEAAEEKPLLHTWSLSLEEQFYLFIPLLLILLYRFRKASWVAPVLLLGAVASFALSVYGSYRAPAATFFLLPMRGWELAAGSLLAFAAPLSRPLVRSAMAWCGLAAVLLPFFFYSSGIRFPGLTALPPVAGAALLIWSGLRLPSTTFQPLPHRILALRPLVWIGLISYSLYLWHWPLFAFHKYLSFTPAPLPLALALVVASFVLAWLTLRFVERPFRSRSVIQTRQVAFGLSVLTMGALVCVSLLLWQSDGARGRLSQQALRYAEARLDFAFISELTASDIPDEMLRLGSIGPLPKVLGWGDGHAMAIVPAVDAVCKELGSSARAATASSTAPLLEWFKVTRYGLNEEAPAFNAAVLAYIKETAPKGLTHVILAARWEAYLDGSASDEVMERALQETVREILRTGCKVSVLKEVPQFPFDVPKTLVLDELRGQIFERAAITAGTYSRETVFQSSILESCVSDGVILIEPIGLFADSEGLIRPADGKGAFYRDSHHLSIYGSMRLKPVLSGFLGSR